MRIKQEETKRIGKNRKEREGKGRNGKKQKLAG